MAEVVFFLRGRTHEIETAKEYLKSIEFPYTTYVDGKQNLVEEEGEFSINEDDMSIHISGVSSIADFSDAHSTLSTSTVDVITIDDTEYVYSFENGGDKHEFRFMKKE